MKLVELVFWFRKVKTATIYFSFPVLGSVEYECGKEVWWKVVFLSYLEIGVEGQETENQG